MFFRLARLWIASSLVLAGCASQPLTVVRSLAVREPDFELGQLTPQTHFVTSDVIRVMAFMGWPDATEEGGQHDVEWNWYRASILVSRTPSASLRFKSTPFELWTLRAAAGLTPGDYKVDTLVDGKIVATDGFTVDPS